MPLGVDISPTSVRALLGFSPRDRAFKARSIHSGALGSDALKGIWFELFPDDLVERDQLLQRLFLTIMRDYFLANNSSTVLFSIMEALRDVDRIGYYDWGSFIFAYFLYGTRLRSEGQTDAWLGFYPIILVSFLFDSLSFLVYFFSFFLLMSLLLAF